MPYLFDHVYLRLSLLLSSLLLCSRSVLGDDGDALAQELDAAVDEDNATRGAVRTAAVIAGKRKEADLSDDESELEDNNDESASEEDDSDDEEDADAASGHGKGAKGRGKKSSSRAKRSVHFEEFARSASARKGAAKKKKEKAAATTSATRKGGVQRAPSSLFAPSASEVALAVARIGTRGRSSSNQQGATGAQSRRRKKVIFKTEIIEILRLPFFANNKCPRFCQASLPTL
jgi:hypothetical protein